MTGGSGKKEKQKSKMKRKNPGFSLRKPGIFVVLTRLATGGRSLRR